jgi:EpsI family protein
MSRLYCYLLRLYPRNFRNKYGRAMLQLFRDRVRGEGGWRVWGDVVVELLTSLPREHWRAHPHGLGIAGATLAATPLILWIVFLREPRLAYLPLADLPSVAGEWNQPYDLPAEESVYAALGTRDILNRVYSGKRGSVNLFVVHWASSSFMISRLGPEMHGWKIAREETKVIPIAGGISVNARSEMVTKGSDSALVIYWYQTKQKTSGDVLWSGLLRRLGIAARWADSAAVRVILRGDGTEDGYDAAAARFVQAIYPELSKRL